MDFPYKVEYAKSGRAGCRNCKSAIKKDSLRLAVMVQSPLFDGKIPEWYHHVCFFKKRFPPKTTDEIEHFESLRWEDQELIKKNIESIPDVVPDKKGLKEVPAIKQEDIPEKKLKIDTVDAAVDNKEDKKLKVQNKIIFKYRDNLKDLPKKELIRLLEENNQQVPTGREVMLDRLSDLMTFGTLLPCEECNGQFVFEKVGYICHGNVTEWSKCIVTTKSPKRIAFVVPAVLKKTYAFLQKYKYVPKARVIKDVKLPPQVKMEEESIVPKIQPDALPLYDMEFVLIGELTTDKGELENKITMLGGKVVTKIKSTVMAVISTEADVEAQGSRIKEALNADIHVVPEIFLDEVTEYSGRIPDLVIKKSICSWGSDPYTRLPPEPSSSNLKSKSCYMSSVPTTVKLKVKDGTAVDPDSGLDNSTHVYVSGKDKYTVVLGLTDIQKQKNSFYKLQLLEADGGNSYYVFRAWGRIGTTIGANKVDKCINLKDAIEQFCSHYEEHSGNSWYERENFVKIPGKMYPIDLDYGEDDELQIDTEIPSKLAKPIQDLIQLIFDVDNMKQVMKEFELDIEKMPLGQLSKTQLGNAYSVLYEMQQLIESNAPELHLIDASNRFYTFVPHVFGVNGVPIIKDLETIQKKVEMLDNLMELEVAYNLMKSSGIHNSIDGYYDQLNTVIEVLDNKSEEFDIIKKYVKNTHAATHSDYKLEVEQIFTIKREDEERRFKPFLKLHNHKLLWHGSHTTNYAGILSQGLRIAPPEAPVSGYMFGKGIYFADMVSKSANYCYTSPFANTGLMLLSDVALGEMYELYNAKNVEKLPAGKHSVKGLGRIEPDPSGTVKIKNDVEVPIGKGINSDLSQNTSLLYNEYIIYDVAQANIKYLLRIKFKYQY